MIADHPITAVELMGGPADGHVIDEPRGVGCEVSFLDEDGLYRAGYAWEFDDFGITRGLFMGTRR